LQDGQNDRGDSMFVDVSGFGSL